MHGILQTVRERIKYIMSQLVIDLEVQNRHLSKISIEETKKAREKWLIKGRGENEVQEYHHKRKEEHKIIKNKKK